MPEDQQPVQTVPSLVDGPRAAEDPQQSADPTEAELRAALGGGDGTTLADLGVAVGGSSQPAPGPDAVVFRKPTTADVLRIVAALDPAETKAVGAKHGDGDFMPFPVTSVGPFGGAESFADYDAWKQAVEVQGEVDTLTFAFDGLISNIRNDPELTLAQKATNIALVAGELGRRVEAQNSSHLDEDEKALDEPSSATFWFQAENFSFTYVDDQKDFAQKVATKRDRGVELKASDFADVPDATKPGGWKLPLVTGRSGNFDLARIGDAITALQPTGFRGNPVQLGSPKGRVKSRIRSAISRASGPADRKKALLERLGKAKDAGDPGSLVVFKDRDGRQRWLTIHSNEYVDREGEAFHKEAHDEFVRWVDTDKAERMPELRVFHVPGSGLGRADIVDHTSEGFMIASGTFYPQMEYVAKGLAERDDLGVSHGFWFDPAAFHGGVYHRYRSFEVSVLPRDRAANEATGFIAGKEVPMLNEDKKAELVAVGGAAWADAVESGLSELAKEADEKGLQYKEIETRVLAALTPAKEKAEGDPAGGPTPDPTTVRVGLDAVIAPIAQGMAAIADTVKTIGADVKAQGEQIAALKEGDDEKIADAFRPRFDPTKGAPASEDPNNEPSAEVKATVEKSLEGDVPDYLKPYVNNDGSLAGLNANVTPVPEGMPA
ncbi:hypothetical protein LCGC14_0443870 [marine sediment metagenome]|uniref:Uncharacterized protein n=1 Tax=marine sediment metagenome TaxID=412755 RepID=A0A0F9V6P9_9ZZZZ